MKNRTREMWGELRVKNGRFFCWHSWEVCGEVGEFWDLCIYAKIPARCGKCGKEKDVSNTYIDEVPDHLINKSIQYPLPW